MDLDSGVQTDDPPLAYSVITAAATDPSPTPEARPATITEEAAPPAQETMPSDVVAESIQVAIAPEIVALSSPELPEPATKIATECVPASSIPIASTSAPVDEVPAGILLALLPCLLLCSFFNVLMFIISLVGSYSHQRPGSCSFA